MPSPLNTPTSDCELKTFNVSIDIDNFHNQLKLQTSSDELINKQPPASPLPIITHQQSVPGLAIPDKPMAVKSETEIMNNETDQSSWHNSSIKYRRARLKLNLVPLKNLSLPQISRICDNPQTDSNNYSESNLNELSSSISTSLVANGHSESDNYIRQILNKTKYNPEKFSPISNNSFFVNGNKILIDDKNQNDYDKFSNQPFQCRSLNLNPDREKLNDENISQYDRAESIRRLVRQDGVRINPELDLEKQNWFHGLLTRDEAEQILSKENIGSYLVRRFKFSYTLSLRSIFGYMHFRIFHCGCYHSDRWSLQSPQCVSSLSKSTLISSKFVSSSSLTSALKCSDIEPDQPESEQILHKAQFIEPSRRIQSGNKLKKFPSIPKLIDYFSRHSLTVSGCEYLTLLYPVSVELL